MGNSKLSKKLIKAGAQNKRNTHNKKSLIGYWQISVVILVHGFDLQQKTSGITLQVMESHEMVWVW